MSLEDALKENTAALIALTKAIQGTIPAAGFVHFAGGNILQGSCEQVRREHVQAITLTASQQADLDKHEGKVPNEKPQDSQKSKPITDTSKPSSPESVAVTYDDVKKATNAVSAKLGREKAIAGLARFGVQSATKLSEEQWPEYVAYMTRVAAGELDPEAGE